MAIRPKCNSSDVARAAGVSRTAVSYVLNGAKTASISTETRKRVLQVADELADYWVNTLAKGLKDGKTALIGIHCHIRDDSFHDRILHGIYETCTAWGYTPIVAHLDDSGTSPHDHMLRMLDYRVSGLIRVIGAMRSGEREWLGDLQEHDGVPIVVIDDQTNEDLFDCVVSNDLSGAKSAVEHLISLGHRQIAHLSGGRNLSSSIGRCDGYLAALSEAGIAFEPDLMPDASSFSPLAAVPAMRRLLDMPEPPTAIFAANDLIAAVFRDLARERGLRVPEDIALVGFGDLEVAIFSGISSVNQHPEEIGRLAVERIIERAEGRTDAPVLITVPTRLIVRPSSVGGPVEAPDIRTRFAVSPSNISRTSRTY